MSRGFTGMGARKEIESNFGYAAEPDVALDFTRLNLQARQSFALPARFGLVLAAAGQYSGDRLPTSEQVSYGRWRYAMGYPQGEQRATRAWAPRSSSTGASPPAGAICRPCSPTSWPTTRALVQQRRPAAPQRPPYSSVSLGLRVTDDKYYLFDFNVARPVADLPTGDDRRGLQFSANYSLFYDAM